MKERIEELAWKWITTHSTTIPTDCLVFFNTCVNGYTAEFYNFNNDKDFSRFFITTEMVEKLLNGTNPKNIKPIKQL